MQNYFGIISFSKPWGLKHMLHVFYMLLIIVSFTSASQARTESTSTKDLLRSTILNYFTPYTNINDGQEDSIQDQLLNTHSESKLSYPPFPRTWIERFSSDTAETTTTALFDTSKIAQAIGTFTGPLALPISVILNGAQLSYRYEHSIKYSYTKQTTLMVMSSWRQFRDPENPNSTKDNAIKNILENSVIDQKPDLRNYFKVSDEYPLLGMCKYEMSLVIQKISTNTVNLVFGSKADSDNVVDGMSYTVYSNFFQIEGHVPVQEYLHVRCGENFTEAVRFLVESEFNKMVTEAFAHYHPKSQCRWSPPSTKTPKTGDQDCLSWFNKLNTLNLDKKNTVPRCILGEEGYPVCAARTSKVGSYCPLYSSRGQISTKEPEIWERQLNPMDSAGFIGGKILQQCDHGLECRLDNGNPISSILLSRDRNERLRHLQNANYITTCQPIVNRGGR